MPDGVTPESIPATLRAALSAGLRQRKISQRQIGQDLGTTDATVSRWLSGEIPMPGYALLHIAERAGVSLADPDGDSVTSRSQEEQVGGDRGESLAADASRGYVSAAPRGERVPVHLEYVYYPILGKANCGPGGGAIYPEGESVAIPRQAVQALRVVRAEDLKCIELAGSCMTPLIRDGDFALFDPNTVPQDGEVVCITWIHDGDEEHIVKRITHLDKEGRIALEPDVAIPGMTGRVELNLHDEGVILEGVLVQVIHNINRPRPPIPTVSYRRSERFVPRASSVEDVG
jgi:phage repressor protein C with HTH and peptisase S24 domain